MTAVTEAKKQKTMPLFTDRYRYFILVLSLLCLTSISSNMVTFNIAILCMSPHKNVTTELNEQHVTYDYSNTEQSMLIWAVGVGSFVGTFPFSFLYSKYGGKYIFFAAGVTSIISTVLTPLAASIGFAWFLVVRFLQGIAYSADFAAIGLLTSRWALLTCYSPLSSTLTNVFSGYICESALGWPFIYYFHSIAGVLLFALWFRMYNDYPDKTSRVSAIELEKIERGKQKEQLELNSFVPYWKICTNLVVLIVWFNAFVEIFSGIFLVTYTPIYLRNVHGYSVETTGVLSSLPPLINMPVRVVFGLISDKIKFCTERTKMNIFNTFSVLGPAICYGVVALLPHDNHLTAVILFILINFFYAASGGGFYKCATLTCRQHSQFIIANIQFVKCLTLFVGPLMYAVFVHDSSQHDQWQPIFIIISAFLVLATVLFLIFSTDQPQEFTKIKSKPENSNESNVEENSVRH
ncbi:Transporter, major facilitator family protein [Aphelenchoides bicaudatus]|nr:Transporter, major facilitator family protein [Aphelenchoides bicaudatus]